MNPIPPIRKKRERQGPPKTGIAARNVKAEIVNLRVLADMVLQTVEKGTYSENVIPALEAYGKYTLQVVGLLKADRLLQESRAKESLNEVLTSMSRDSQAGSGGEEAQ
jgi:hypothetical protein